MRTMGGVIVVTLLLAGCVPPSVISRPMRSLRERNGACAGVQKMGLSAVAIKSCLVTGSPGTLHDDDAPRIITVFKSSSRQMAQPNNWQLSVTHQESGQNLFRDVLEHDLLSVGYCNAYGCQLTGIDVTGIGSIKGWQPGTYILRFICTFDTSKTAEMQVTLTGSLGEETQPPIVEGATGAEVTPEPADPETVEPSEAGWYILLAGQQVGPVTLGKMLDMLNGGQVTKTTIVRTAGGGAWGPAGERKELFPE